MSSTQPSGEPRVVALSATEYATLLHTQLAAAHDKLSALCHELSEFGWPHARLEDFADTLRSLCQPNVDSATGDLTPASRALAELAALEVVLARENLHDVDQELCRMPGVAADDIRCTLRLALQDLDVLDALDIEPVAA